MIKAALTALAIGAGIAVATAAPALADEGYECGPHNVGEILPADEYGPALICVDAGEGTDNPRYPADYYWSTLVPL